MGLNLDEILNYMKYSTLNTNRKYQEIQIENMFSEEQKIWIVKEIAVKINLDVKKNRKANRLR